MDTKNGENSRLRRTSTLIKTVLSGSFLAAIAATGAGLYVSNRILYMKKKEDAFIIERETSSGRYDVRFYESLPKKDVWITSGDGTLLKSVFVTPYPGNPYVIFCHGVTEHKINSIKYMNLFLKHGFNAVLYDHRRHGESEGTFTSYGHFEKHDLKAVIEELTLQEGPNVRFGIHGESMGAATLLLYAGTIEDRADFYIADCPFSDFRKQVEHQVKKEIGWAPFFMTAIAEWAVWFRQRFKLSDLSPLEAVKHIKKPVLFIHSEQDDFILPDMTKALFEAKQGPKQLFLAPNGLHAQSYNENSELYEKAIDQFLMTYHLKP